MVIKSAVSVIQILLLVQFNVYLATDWLHGWADPFGPYPRIPDKELLQVTSMIVVILNLLTLNIHIEFC